MTDTAGSSNRWIWIVALAVVLLVGGGALVALSWPEILLRYHRHRFRPRDPGIALGI